MTNPTDFTDRELDIMGVLWRLGSGTVADVQKGLARPVGYTTVLKQLQILEEKGAVRHEREGRAYRYHPVTDAAEAGDTALRRLLDTVFDGSAEAALARLVSEAPPDPAEIARMRAILDELDRAVDEEEGDR
ncbi:BlaI/MecI/CopY family transcriptional regulator [Gemmatimonadota bacterium DH-20]|uniref:BlaI/MecI/CopY family transcriptional regulator n=1 Tax=Gaopeijia maritima TaxID=3119007 RepID=A0ABU9E7S4_9BACT